jgi:hypothetical protein
MDYLSLMDYNSDHGLFPAEFPMKISTGKDQSHQEITSTDSIPEILRPASNSPESAESTFLWLNKV